MLSARPWPTIDSGYSPAICAPARYSGTCGPGTLEMARLAKRIRPASPERPYSEASPLSSHGDPIDGKSFGIRLPKVPICAFIARVPAMISARRLIGSLRCVARSISVPDTWLLLVASPSARSEIGTPATSDFSGSSRPSAKYSRNAVLHSHSTMSLIDAPCALPIALTSCSGSDTPANTRWLVIEVLNGVGGASLKRVGTADLPLPARRAASADL